MTDTAPGTPLLELDQLSAGYADDPVVVDFTASIPAGTITTVISPNGAGKSTLLRAIAGTNRHFGGGVKLLGQSIERLTPTQRLKLGVGCVPQGRCNFPLMTVRENLELGAFTLSKSAAAEALDRVLAQFPLLAAKLAMLAGNMSGGEQQILETAMVLESGPTLLLLDEPSLGLSPGNQEQVFATIAELRGRGLTVLVVEQNAHGALGISDIGIVMELGRLFAMGPAQEILHDPRIKLAYLGGG